jgi:hypothetical protein
VNPIYSIWIVADRVHEGGYAEGEGNSRNYCLTISRADLRNLYAELKQEFG